MCKAEIALLVSSKEARPTREVCGWLDLVQWVHQDLHLLNF